jgi:isoleucyl-tRNA synthetase
MRYYMLSSQIVEAEPLAFSEKGVDEVYKKIILRLLNVVSFYEMYREADTEARRNSDNILDKWIIARLDEVVGAATTGMEAYKLNDACRPFMDFVDDLSTWYVRRSRDRFKGDDNNEKEKADKKAALQTTKYILSEFSKTIAPFMPFLAESVYQRVQGKNFVDENTSVHLENWPKSENPNDSVLKEMKTVREIVSLGLLERDKVGIKVRQPLQTLKTTYDTVTMNPYSVELIKEEVNVKEVVFDSSLEQKAQIDSEITDELRREGIARELIRFVQTLRKNNKLNPDDEIMLTIDTSSSGRDIIENNKVEILEKVRAKHIEFRENDGEELVADDITFKVSIS